MTNPERFKAPSAWLEGWLPGAARAGATALDVACGSGRHVQLARDRGYVVTGLDRDVTGVSGSWHALAPDEPARVRLLAADLEDGSPWPLPGQTFDVVIVTNYLHRPRLADIVSAVADHGMLIYETFAVGQERYGRPSNPDFLLRPGELLEALQGQLTPFAYEHLIEANPERLVQRIVAVGPKHRWIAEQTGPDERYGLASCVR